MGGRMEKKRLSKSFYGAALVCMVCCSFALGTTLETTAAWQVSGKVTDVHGNVIAGAQVCPQGSATGCVTTATNGTFSISGNAVGVRLDPSAQPSGKAVTLAARNGKLFLSTPGALSGSWNCSTRAASDWLLSRTFPCPKAKTASMRQ